MHIRLKSALALGVALFASPALAQDANVKIGFIGGLTGPIESLMPPIQAGAELAVSQVNENGGLFGEGAQAEMIVVDDGCVDAARAADAGDRVVNTEQVVGIVGAMCSGATTAAANAAAIPAGVVMVSPASTSPALTTLEDQGLVFRTVPSDAYQGEVLAQALVAKDIDTVAVTYVNNDYGTAFAESFGAAFEAAGGTVSLSEPHEDNRADYRPEIGSLASSGAETLVVLAYVDGSGGTIIRQALETGDFSSFAGGDGMVGATLADAAEGAEQLVLTRPGGGGADGYANFETAAGEASLDPTATYAATSYDAAFALLLAIEKNGAAREGLADALREVVNAPGEVVLPGEWAKAKELLAAGTDINYEGASGALEFDDAGDVPGTYDEVTVEGGEIVVVGDSGAATGATGAAPAAEEPAATEAPAAEEPAAEEPAADAPATEAPAAGEPAPAAN